MCSKCSTLITKIKDAVFAVYGDSILDIEVWSDECFIQIFTECLNIWIYKIFTKWIFEYLKFSLNIFIEYSLNIYILKVANFDINNQIWLANFCIINSN